MKQLLAALCLVTAAGTTVFAQDTLKAPAIDPQIGELVEQLGDSQFAVRQRAQEQLEKLGFAAFDALVAAEQHQDPEVAMQARYLVRRIRAGWTADNDPRPIREIMKNYEAQGDEERRAKITQLAELPDDAGLKWLCRLARFERSLELSKWAAIEIMSHPPKVDAGWTRRSRVIHEELDGSQRAAARWLEVYLAAHSDPAGTVQRWSELADAEQAMLLKQPQDSDSQIVLALLKREVQLLDELGRQDQIEPVVRQMIQVERGDSQSLGEMIQWLAERQSWNMIDLVAERFSASFDVDAVLLYMLAEARLAQGDQKLAEEAAGRALAIHGDSQQEHVLLASRLGDRGLPHWADREWAEAIRLGPTGTQWDVMARKLLANSYHDQQNDAAAAKLIEELLTAAEKDQAIMQRVRAAQQQQYETSVDALRSDMYFYQACQAQHDGDVERQRSLLDQSLAQNRSNIEALIELYKITAGDTKRRGELATWSKEFIDMCRARIDDEPENPTYYNQIAWLIANTEGDREEAVELSKRSIEAAKAQGDPPSRLGGLYDTLAHAHYAKGDLAAAVAAQEEALRLDPHTRSIRRALDMFRAERDKAAGK
jgi:tetratricopeptide (TPR) repeat protein